MLILVCYDVNTETKLGRRRLRQVAKLCESHGQRAQKSVFECNLTEVLYIQFESRLLGIIDEEEDNLRFYFIDEGSKKKTKIFGVDKVVDFEKNMVL